MDPDDQTIDNTGQDQNQDPDIPDTPDTPDESEVNGESILNSIKKLLGPDEDYTHFDQDIILHINAAFSRLCQLGVGSEKYFKITDATAVWTDFIEDGYLEDVKQYVFLKVKQVFDPPTNATLMNALETQIDKLEWLLNSVAEVGY